ncbi:hypothetical protein HPB48_000434 [Haemaphysalis longicornis]|uniref:Uncharacterized protein n=1 Tax=Haemaphysalis longicornis TaxID=44386 RepID=A0A9J6FW50_HAELO|nr:hypothetical protein HPB48_000434 [Haemaphysalis longicornis]
MSLGVWNTLEEIREALLISQKQRLEKTKAGKAILQKVGSPADVHSTIDKVDLSREVRTRLKVLPPPRNMDPCLHNETRIARVAFLRKQLENKKTSSTPTLLSTAGKMPP